MVEREQVAAWLADYVAAWRSNDERLIASRPTAVAASPPSGS